MKKYLITLIAGIIAAMSFTGCTITETTEKCVAIDSHTFQTADGNLFTVNDTLMTGETYIVIFISYDSNTRTDDMITCYNDLELWELSQDYMQ